MHPSQVLSVKFHGREHEHPASIGVDAGCCVLRCVRSGDQARPGEASLA